MFKKIRNDQINFKITTNQIEDIASVKRGEKKKERNGCQNIIFELHIQFLSNGTCHIDWILLFYFSKI